MKMMSDSIPDAPEPVIESTVEVRSAASEPDTPPEPSVGGAKLFVIFFLTIVPLLGMAIMGFVIYRLLAR
jgi:hypothetical protein